MTWVKLDDGFFSSPAALSIGKDAKILHVAGLCYCGGNLTDGAIPAGALPILGAQTGVSATRKATAELVTADLWRKTEGGFEIVDYLEANSSAADVQAKRHAAKERMKQSRQEKRSQNVRANKVRSSREVREPDTDTDTDNVAGSDLKPQASGGEASPRGASRPASATRPNPEPTTVLDGPSSKKTEPLIPPTPSSPTTIPAPTPTRSDGQVYAMVDAYAKAKGVRPTDVSSKDRNQAFNVFKSLPAGFTADEVDGCTRYFLSDPFWREPGKLTFQKVADTLPEWRAQGMPETMLSAVRGRSGGSTTALMLDRVRQLREAGQ